MKTLLELLNEDFPPKKKPFPPKKAGNDAKPNPFQKKSASPTTEGADDDSDVNGDISLDDGDDQSQGVPGQAPQQDPAQLFMLKQQMQAEKEQAEAQARRQKAEEEAAERQRIKQMRLDADEEVASALIDKYNAADDQVIFFPDIISFSRYEEDEQNGKTGTGEKEVRPGQETRPPEADDKDSDTEDASQEKGSKLKKDAASEKEDEETDDGSIATLEDDEEQENKNDEEDDHPDKDEDEKPAKPLKKKKNPNLKDTV